MVGIVPGPCSGVTNDWGKKNLLHCFGKEQFCQEWQRGTMVTDGNIVNFEYVTSGQGKPNELCT